MNFLNADSLPGEDRAEIDLFPTETDTAAMGDHDGSVVERVVDVRQPLVGEWRRCRHRQDTSCLTPRVVVPC